MQYLCSVKVWCKQEIKKTLRWKGWVWYSLRIFKLWLYSNVSWSHHCLFNLFIVVYGWWMVLPQAQVFRQHDPKLEEIIQEGCRILAAQDKPKYTEVARGLSECHSIPVPAQTLCNHFLGEQKVPEMAIKISSFSPLSRNEFSWTGFSISAQQAIHSVKGPSNHQSQSPICKILQMLSTFQKMEWKQILWADSTITLTAIQSFGPTRDLLAFSTEHEARSGWPLPMTRTYLSRESIIPAHRLVGALIISW